MLTHHPIDCRESRIIKSVQSGATQIKEGDNHGSGSVFSLITAGHGKDRLSSGVFGPESAQAVEDLAPFISEATIGIPLGLPPPPN